MRNPSLLKTLYVFLMALGVAVRPAVAATGPHISNVLYDVAAGVVKIQLTAPTPYQTTAWESKRRFAVDVDATGIDLELRQLPVYAARLKTVRWNQWRPDNVRVVLDLNTDDRPVVLSASPTDLILIRVTPPVAVKDRAPGPSPQPSARTTEDSTPTPKGSRARVQDLFVERDDDGHPDRVVIQTDRDTAAKASWWDNHLAIDLPDAEPGRERIVPVNDPALLRVRTGVFEGHARVVLDMTGRVNYKVSSLPDNSGIAVDLIPDEAAPPSAVETVPAPTPARHSVRALKDMLIVVDPGHGGYQGGATGPYIQEKNATLDMAMRLAALLKSEGARVVMTRTTDAFVGLLDRRDMAMRLHADVFVSIHCNSSRSATDGNHGAEVWYRRFTPESRRLAMCLYKSHLDATGLYGRGVKPDTAAPQGGLAVLKYNSVPCALVETAFINHSGEGQKLASPEWRQRVAEGLLEGLKHFAEGGD